MSGVIPAVSRRHEQVGLRLPRWPRGRYVVGQGQFVAVGQNDGEVVVEREAVRASGLVVGLVVRGR